MKKREQAFAGVTVTGVAAKITAELEIFKRKPDVYNHNKNPTWLNPSNDELKHIYNMTAFVCAYKWGRGFTHRCQFAPRSSFYLEEYLTNNFN